MTENEKNPLTLCVFSPTGVENAVACDSVRLFAADGADGKNGGSLGIHYGHAPAMVALGDGPLLALLKGETVYRGAFPGGIAVIERDTVTVFTVPPDRKEKAVD